MACAVARSALGGTTDMSLDTSIRQQQRSRGLGGVSSSYQTPLTSMSFCVPCTLLSPGIQTGFPSPLFLLVAQHGSRTLPRSIPLLTTAHIFSGFPLRIYTDLACAHQACPWEFWPL